MTFKFVREVNYSAESHVNLFFDNDQKDSNAIHAPIKSLHTLYRLANKLSRPLEMTSNEVGLFRISAFNWKKTRVCKTNNQRKLQPFRTQVISAYAGKTGELRKTIQTPFGQTSWLFKTCLNRVKNGGFGMSQVQAHNNCSRGRVKNNQR